MDSRSLFPSHHNKFHQSNALHQVGIAKDPNNTQWEITPRYKNEGSELPYSSAIKFLFNGIYLYE